MNKQKKKNEEVPESANGWLQPLLSVMVVTIAVLHAYAGFAPSGVTWGFHHLGFLPLAWKIAIPLLMISILHTRVQIAVLAAFRWVEEATKSASKLRLILIALGCLAIAALVFSYGKQATFFLGDGIFAQRSLTNIKTAENIPVALQNAPLPGFLTWKIYQSALVKDAANPPAAAFQLVSIAAGLLGIPVLFFLARFIARDRLEQFILFSLLLVGGTIQLFFGYVENYTIAFLMLLLFLWLSMGYLHGKTPLWLPSIAFGMMFASHFGMVYLAPALLLLYFNAFKKKKPLDILVAVGLVLVATYLVLQWCGYSIETVQAIFNKEGGGHRVPLFDKSTGWHGYTMFSPWHFVDIANLYLLLSPFTIPLFLLIGVKNKGAVTTRNIPWLFLVAIALFSLAFTIGFNFDIGMSRDWDLLVPYNLGLIVAGGFAIVHFVHDSALRRKILLVSAWVTLLHSVPWIVVNARVDPSIDRFTVLRDDRLWGAAAIIYANEDLGGYYRDNGDYKRAISFYREGLDIDSTNSRRWLVIANAYQMNGQEDLMLYSLDKAVQLGTRSMQTYAQVGELYVKRNQHEKAIEVWKKALEVDPSQVAFSYYIGATLTEHLGNPEDGLTYLLQASKAFPDAPEILYSLGSCYKALGNKTEMKKVWGRFVQLVPTHPEANRIRAELLKQK